MKHITLLLLASIHYSYGQISPGPLTSAHAELEGIRNCTKCHDLGSNVSDQKCLECHQDIQTLIDEKRGYHASPEALNQQCFECHSEHHGKKFDMMRFDQDNFDHNLAGYELEGQHGVIDCRECHKPDFIQDPEIRQRSETFLGLDQECLSCHDDYHQQTLSNDCIACHNIESFRPAPGFDHDEAEYALKGAHVSVDCIECHEVIQRNGKEFQVFTGIPFERCTDCHEDAHEGRIAGTCTQCHTEESFDTFTGNRRFNHNTTDFTLKGQHRTINCFTCHDQSSNPLTVFRDQQNIEENNCVACHEDVHEGKYGLDCAQCHNERDFLELNNMDFFDHSVTDYPLEGKHQEVECRECHTERYSTPIDFSACNNCHEDYHLGEFAENGVSPDCIECHSLAHGFDYSLFTLEQHQETVFPLTGAHLATPCFACHINEEEDRWTFRNIGSECIDCHEDIHEDYISPNYYPEHDCKACHTDDTWALITFDHNQTDWPLDGKHVEVDCRDCHFEISAENTLTAQVFKDLDTDCISCHENIHGDEFEIDGVTDCKRCHITETWFPQNFDHNTTRFPLDGRHAEIDCKACHEIANLDGSTDIVYKLEKLECIDCHQ